jgi:hypothetical protein
MTPDPPLETEADAWSSPLFQQLVAQDDTLRELALLSKLTGRSIDQNRKLGGFLVLSS